MRVVAFWLLAVLACPLWANEKSDKEKCEKTKQKIEKIRAKMRQGYSVSEGIRMDDELRRLRKLRSKHCR